MTAPEIIEQLRTQVSRAAAELEPDAPMAVDLILSEPLEDEA